MKLLNTAQIRDWDLFTINNEPIASFDLMERAATNLFHLMMPELLKKFGELKEKHFQVFCGQGNNGGDGLVIARHLADAGFKVEVFVLKIKPNGTTDFENNLTLIKQKNIQIHELLSEEDLINLTESDVLIDALFGSGLNNTLLGLAASTIKFLNQKDAFKISIDIPSGLFGDIEKAIEQKDSEIFQADLTYTFQIPKTSFLFPETGMYAGKFEVVEIGLNKEFSDSQSGNWEWLTESEIPKRVLEKFSQKWKKGHALIIAGSYGKMGAALLCSKAALRSGCGLLTAYIPKAGFTIFQTAFPEAMVQTDDNVGEIRNFPNAQRYDAVGAGPGMGLHPLTCNSFQNFLRHIEKPIVIDADGLNAIAGFIKLNPDFSFPKNCILTPHEKEFDRMFGNSENSFTRLQKATEVCDKYKITIVLKGAHTKIVSAKGKVWFNSSGNNLLATAGSGDVLTGMITSLLAQGFEPEEAAVKGVYLHGLLADSLFGKGFKNCIAGDLIAELKFIR